jgi:hypothetical protein
VSGEGRVQVSNLNDSLLIAISDLANLAVKQRKNIYKRLEMLNIFTTELSAFFEQNIKRINK